MSGTGAAGLGYGDLLLTSLLTLGGVCIAAFVIVRLVGRFLATGRSRGTHMLDVVARLPLEPRRSLYVVDVAGKTLLIGTSEMGLSVLSELDREQVRSEHAARQTFAELVRSAWQRRRASNASKDEQAASELTDAGRTEPSGAEPTRVRRAESRRADGAGSRGADGAGVDAAECRRAGGADSRDAGQADSRNAGRAGPRGAAGAESKGAGSKEASGAESRGADAAESTGRGGAESGRAGRAERRGGGCGEPRTDAGERREEVP
jgi:flagellar biogenesis protein FliO